MKQNNLARSEPERLAETETVRYSLDAQMTPPRWRAPVSSGIAVDYTIDKRPKTVHETIVWTN